MLRGGRFIAVQCCLHVGGGVGCRAPIEDSACAHCHLNLSSARFVAADNGCQTVGSVGVVDEIEQLDIVDVGWVDAAGLQLFKQVPLQCADPGRVCQRCRHAQGIYKLKSDVNRAARGAEGKLAAHTITGGGGRACFVFKRSAHKKLGALTIRCQGGSACFVLAAAADASVHAHTV